jgi:hypothetical protein
MHIGKKAKIHSIPAYKLNSNKITLETNRYKIGLLKDSLPKYIK